MGKFKDKIINIYNEKNILNPIKTPTYIFDINELNESVNLIYKGLGKKYNLCFAMKANPYLVSNIVDKVDRLEVCSPGEYEICIENNIIPEKIIVSGVNKTKETIDRILEYSNGKGIYTIESYEHYTILSKCAKEHNYILDVIIRLSSGNQFGVDKDTLEKIIEEISTCDNLNFIGIHYYSGTQKKLRKIEQEIQLLDEYALHIKKTYNIDYLELEYGPGNVVNYFQSDKKVTSQEQLSELRKYLDATKHFSKITLEYGRFIAATCGYYISKINDIKITDDTGYIILNGGIHHINYYGQVMGMKKPYMLKIDSNKEVSVLDYNDENIRKWQLCGSLCTSNDVIARDVCINNPCRNDLIVFENVGAYSVTEGMALFLSRELPEVYIYTENDELICFREEKETYLFNLYNKKGE